MSDHSRPAAAGPVLVTGMPRSGTTWLARLLASAPGTAMTGREPMNPHRRQYALAGTLRGWTELAAPSPRQERALRRAYRGRTPFVFGRYGRRQWAAPAPWTRVIVKDPYAMLSIATVARVTSASTVLVFRHPAAALVSYRRMGWQPSLDEVRAVQHAHTRNHSGTSAALPVPAAGELDQAETIARFWSALYEIALDHAAESGDLVIVSHEELSGTGAPAARCLFDRLGLRWSDEAAAEMARESAAARAAEHQTRELHQLDRAPMAVATAWRDQLDPHDLDIVERVSGSVHRRLLDARLHLEA